MGDAHMGFCVWKQGCWFESSPLQFELYSRGLYNDKKVRGVHGTPTRVNLNVCGWGLEGKWENLPIKLMFQFIFQITCLSL